MEEKRHLKLEGKTDSYMVIDSSRNFWVFCFCYVKFSRKVWRFPNHFRFLDNEGDTEHMFIFFDLIFPSNIRKTVCNVFVGGREEVGKVLDRSTEIKLLFIF